MRRDRMRQQALKNNKDKTLLICVMDKFHLYYW